MPTIRTNLSPEQVRDIIEQLPPILTGRATDAHELRIAFWSAVAHSLFIDLHNGFLVKSGGGTDELGVKWADLKPKTKAYQRKELRVGIPLPGPKMRPTLYPHEDKAWRRSFVQSMIWLRTQMLDERAIKAKAAAIAWTLAKRMGARTLIGMLGNAKVNILDKSGRLRQSLSPGELVGNPGHYQRFNDDQIFEIDNRGMTIGTSVPYANRVDKKRKLWRDDLGIWWDRAVDAGLQAMVEHIERRLRR